MPIFVSAILLLSSVGMIAHAMMLRRNPDQMWKLWEGSWFNTFLSGGVPERTSLWDKRINLISNCELLLALIPGGIGVLGIFVKHT